MFHIRQDSLATAYPPNHPPCGLWGGVTKNDEEAVKWYRKAADQGFAAAQYNLGGMYYRGEGVAKDEVEAVKWYRNSHLDR